MNPSNCLSKMRPALNDQRIRMLPRSLRQRTRKQAQQPNRKENPSELLSDFVIFGGADRDRTGGLLVANQALSQLSYSPLNTVSSFTFPETRNQKLATDFLVGLGRVELPTSPLSGVRSSQLSYRPGRLIINQNIPEPKTISAHCHPERSEGPLLPAILLE